MLEKIKEILTNEKPIFFVFFFLLSSNKGTFWAIQVADN